MHWNCYGTGSFPCNALQSWLGHSGTQRPHQARDKEPWAWIGLDLPFPEPKKPKIAHVLRYHPGPGCSKAD